MSTTRDPLTLQQDDIYHRVLSDAFLVNCTVLFQRQGIVENDIDNALGTLNKRSGKQGVIIIVLMPKLQREGSGAAAPLYKIVHGIQVVEDPLLNQGDFGTGLSAEQAAQRVGQLLHNFSAGWGSAMSFSSMDPVTYRAGTRSYVVEFELQSGSRAVAKVATPAITSAAAVSPAAGVDVAITCATAGKVIYYTTDGSYPDAVNPEASEYRAPFNVPESAVVRAAAQAEDYQPSNVATLEINL